MSRAGPLALRVVLALAAVAVAVQLAAWRSDRGACTRAGNQVYLRRAGPIGPLDEALARVRSKCRGPSRLLDSSAALRSVRRYRLAATVAREATRDEPRNFVAWADLYESLVPFDPRGAAAARRRAVRLNPLSVRAP
jgi:hypothetical protein